MYPATSTICTIVTIGITGRPRREQIACFQHFPNRSAMILRGCRDLRCGLLLDWSCLRFWCGSSIVRRFIGRELFPTTTADTASQLMNGTFVFWGFTRLLLHRCAQIMQAFEYLRELIPFPSVSCDSNSQITDCIDQWLRQLDFEIERIC